MKKKSSALLVTLLAVITISCSENNGFVEFENNFAKIKLGQTSIEVLDTLGKPCCVTEMAEKEERKEPFTVEHGETISEWSYRFEEGSYRIRMAYRHPNSKLTYLVYDKYIEKHD